MLHFEWDEFKNKSNHKKHDIWFEEAQQVFNDPLALRYFDSPHSEDEDRLQWNVSAYVDPTQTSPTLQAIAK
ncbi:MAG: BrnT family toxin [Oligoflexia bacterium]|nr:BrnT family toxin [Oligoflexia bacterium]